MPDLHFLLFFIQINKKIDLSTSEFQKLCEADPQANQ
jgi:hypothetical protein